MTEGPNKTKTEGPNMWQEWIAQNWSNLADGERGSFRKKIEDLLCM